jgi:phage shock protein A
MNLLGRISRIVAANINHLLEKTEDPDRLLEGMTREMEESVTELRRETVRAVARRRQLEKDILSAGILIEELEEEAMRALTKQDEPLARELIRRKLRVRKSYGDLQDELSTTSQVVVKLRSELTRLQSCLLEAKRGQEPVKRM